MKNTPTHLYDWSRVYGKEDGPAILNQFEGELIVTDEVIEYYIDDLGFRNRDVVRGSGVPCAVGCSYTFGYGVSQPWPELLGVYNMGMNSASNDYITRAAISYCEKYHPKTIHVLWTHQARLEIAIEGSGRGLSVASHSLTDVKNSHKLAMYSAGQDLLVDDQFVYDNYIKNKTLLELYCANHNIELKQAVAREIPKSSDLARDGKHPGQLWQNTVASLLK